MGGDRTYFAGDGVGLFYLTEDLGFTDDHAIERTGNAEEMTHGFPLSELVEVWLDVVGWDGEVLVKEAKEIGFGLRLHVGGFAGVVLQSEELNAIAGGENEAFADSRLMKEGAGGVG